MSDRGSTTDDERPGTAPDERKFAVRDRAVYLPRPDALVIADLHLGRSRTSNVSLPLPEREAIAGRLADLLDAFAPETVVLAGDVCHSFSTIPDGVDDSLDAIRERVREAGAAFVSVAGNHDAMLSSLAEPVDEHRLRDGTLVCHGHEHPDGDADRYVIGHEHPAIEIEGCRYPCHLWGEEVYRRSDVLVLPAFTELAAGAVINGLRGGDVGSPLLSALEEFRPIVWDPGADETLVWPPLSSLWSHL